MHVPHTKELDYYKPKEIIVIEHNHCKPKNWKATKLCTLLHKPNFCNIHYLAKNFHENHNIVVTLSNSNINTQASLVHEP
jgi:hypothetical protein